MQGLNGQVLPSSVAARRPPGARGARDEPGAGVVIVDAAVTVGMGGSCTGHAASEENLEWFDTCRDEIRYLLPYLLHLYLKSSCFFHKENPSEKEITLKMT